MLTKSTIFANYNAARALVRDGALDAGRLNRALGIAQSKERKHIAKYHTTSYGCECPDRQYNRWHVCKGMLALVLMTEEERTNTMTTTDETPMTVCDYCNRDVPDEGDFVPEVSDDDEWEQLAALHADDCEWIITRAHRVSED